MNEPLVVTWDPLGTERAVGAAADRARTRFIVSADPDEAVEQVAVYVDQGFAELVFHFPSYDRPRQAGAFASDVLPCLRERFG